MSIYCGCATSGHFAVAFPQLVICHWPPKSHCIARHLKWLLYCHHFLLSPTPDVTKTGERSFDSITFISLSSQSVCLNLVKRSLHWVRSQKGTYIKLSATMENLQFFLPIAHAARCCDRLYFRLFSTIIICVSEQIVHDERYHIADCSKPAFSSLAAAQNAHKSPPFPQLTSSHPAFLQ